MKYDLASLAARMCLTEHQAAVHLGVSGSTFQTYRDQGMSREVAERRALQAGVHPYEVWPEMADHDLDALSVACACGCGVTFVPARSGHKFSSTACKGRAHSREHARRKYADDPVYRERKRQAAAAYYQEARSYVIARQRRWDAENRDRINARRREARRRPVGEAPDHQQVRPPRNRGLSSSDQQTDQRTMEP